MKLDNYGIEPKVPGNFPIWMSTLHYKSRFSQIQSFSLVLAIEHDNFYFGILPHSWHCDKYEFEIAWTNLTVILFLTVTWLCMKLESSTITAL